MAFNSKAEDMFGYKKEEVTGRPCEVLMGDKYKKNHQVCRVGRSCSRGVVAIALLSCSQRRQ